MKQDHSIIRFTFNTEIDISSIIDEPYAERWSIPDDFVVYLNKKTNEDFRSVWLKIPHYVSEMFDTDSLKDNEDNYRVDARDGYFYWYSDNMTFYIDRNQWMKLDPKLIDSYEYRCDNRYYCNLVVKYKDIYDNFTIDEIWIDVSVDGDIEQLSIYPENKIPKIMTKEQLISAFGEDDGEE